MEFVLNKLADVVSNVIGGLITWWIIKKITKPAKKVHKKSPSRKNHKS